MHRMNIKSDSLRQAINYMSHQRRWKKQIQHGQTNIGVRRTNESRRIKYDTCQANRSGTEHMRLG